MRQPPKTNAQRQAAWRTRQKAAAAKGRELLEGEAYLNWKMNPCGKPPLGLGSLKRQAERLADGVFVMGIDCEKELRRNSLDRRAALTNLEGAVHANPACPPLFGYFEGMVDGRYMIEVYGRGEVWTKLPQPRRPAFMDAVKGKDGRIYMPVTG